MRLKFDYRAAIATAVPLSILLFAGALFFQALIATKYAENRMYVWEGPPVTIVLDETKLVRCGKIDRSQPSCTLLSECEDHIDRCVVSFEIFRRPVLPSELEPVDQSE